MRRVMVSKRVHHPYARATETTPAEMPWVELVAAGEALFHQFGVTFEEFESGPGNISTAIVEWPDGRVEEICPLDLLRFLEPVKVGA